MVLHLQRRVSTTDSGASTSGNGGHHDTSARPSGREHPSSTGDGPESELRPAGCGLTYLQLHQRAAHHNPLQRHLRPCRSAGGSIRSNKRLHAGSTQLIGRMAGRQAPSADWRSGNGERRGTRVYCSATLLSVSDQRLAKSQRPPQRLYFRGDFDPTAPPTSISRKFRRWYLWTAARAVIRPLGAPSTIACRPNTE